MAIPKKPVVKNPLKNFLKSLFTATREIPNLPKKNLLKITSYITFALFGGIYYAVHSRIMWPDGRIREAELLRKRGVVGTSTSDNPGTVRAYDQSYGLDFREKFEKAEAGDSES